ncbi:hypothetical protein MMC07_007858 [Pseudocyphellaria aurata]|nr:hypothetical protein [Pseudocyphellaria aurata]
MSVKACDDTIATGTKCSTESEHINWLCEEFEFRVAAVCWNCINAGELIYIVPAVPPPSVRLSAMAQLRAQNFLLAECSVLYVPFCQQQVLDGHIPRLPTTWKLEDIAMPSVEPNWFDDEKISTFDMPHLGTPEQSRDLVALLGTAATETKSGDGRQDFVL